jgi:sialate O-acetylesterase
MRRLASACLVTVAGLVFGPVPASNAAVKPNGLFTDNMVLQRGMEVPVWGTAEVGEKITVSIQGQETSTTADKQGKWLVRFKPLQEGGPYDMKIKGHYTIDIKNVLVGEVWICSGQSNMEQSLATTDNAASAIAESGNAQIRMFVVPHTISGTPLSDTRGRWQECGPKTVPNFSAVAYYFGRDLQKALNVPVGLIESNWGGTVAEAWATREALDNQVDLKYLLDAKDKAFAAGQTSVKNPNLATVLYNGMIAPLQPYAIKGAIWYQGESNAGRAYEYRTLFPVMIESWRKSWSQGDFPFLFVQLAPWRKIVTEPADSDWAELREAQLLTTQHVKNSAMAVITDVGDEKDIHPRKKEPVGARLALAAQAIAYQKPVEYSGPVYDSMKKAGDRIVVHFKHAEGGLEVRGEQLQGFTIAGPDHKFVNADAKIDGDSVVVSSPEVSDPSAVRFGWANYPVCNLWNKAGLPATPFRTDDFPMVTNKKKPAK